MIEPGDLPPELRNVRIPDDARELDPDRLAYYRELAARRRADQRATRRRLTTRITRRIARRVEGFGIGPLSIGLLIATALVAAVTLVLSPRALTPATPLRLASPSAEVGDVGGLLPDATVVVAGRERSLRDARPVVLVLPPADGCDDACRLTVSELAAQAAPLRIPVAFAGTPDRSESLVAASAAALSGAPVVLDPGDALTDAYLPTGTTAVLVHGDGVVADVARDLRPGVRMHDDLSVLARPGARPDSSTGTSP